MSDMHIDRNKTERLFTWGGGGGHGPVTGNLPTTVRGGSPTCPVGVTFDLLNTACPPISAVHLHSHSR